MTEFPLPLPFGGVSDDQAFGKQDLATSREIFNMRPEDPENGRERIAYRSGMSKACADPVEVGVPIAEICSTVYDGRNVEYEAGTETEEWKKAVPSGQNAPGCYTDSDGNLYALDGLSGVVKFNPSGEIVWQFPLPSLDDSFSCRFIFVDDLFDVYVGISTGKRQAKTRMWKLTQLPDSKVEVAWEVETGAYVEAGVVRNDKLYTVQNEPDTGAAFVRVYSALDAGAPILKQEWRCAYPANDMDVNKSGAVFVASQVNLPSSSSALGVIHRPGDPRFPKFGPDAQDWTPFKLDNYEKRIWSWFVADDITSFDVQGAFADGATVRRWPDRSGHNRHLYAPLLPLKAPTLALKACLLRNAVRFDGSQSLTSLPNHSTTKAFADQQKTALPGYVGSMFLTVMVVRPEIRTTGNPMWIFGQENQAAGAKDHILFANRGDGNAPSFVSGALCHFAATDGTDPGNGTNGHPLFSGISPTNEIAIVAILWDGGIDPGVSLTKTRSLFQQLGFPRDRYLGLGNLAQAPTILGKWNTTDGGAADPLKGDVLEWITLDRINRDDDVTEPKVLTHDAFEDGDLLSASSQTDNELTRIVGYLAHKYGVQHLLTSETGGVYPHPYGGTSETIDGTTIHSIWGPPTDSPLVRHGRTERGLGLLTKYDPQGKLVWAINSEEEDPLEPGKQAVGFGTSVRVDKDGNLFSFGFEDEFWDHEGTKFLRKVIDQGDTFSLAAADGAWSVVVPSPAYTFPRMTVDEFGNLYFPSSVSDDGALRVYDGTDGTLLASVVLDDPPAPGFAVAVDPKIPDYRDDLDPKIARFAYVAGQGNVWKIRLVQQTPIAGPPRLLANLAISREGAIRTFEVGGALATPAGATGILSSSPVFVQATALHGKIYITDGVSDLVVFDPILDTVTKLVSTTAGEPGHGCKILEAWNGRLVMARSPNLINGAFNWLMSARNKPTEYDTSPVEQRNAAAIGGENSEGPGIAPDIVNGFAPLSEDLAIWGCDHSIYRMTGDPGEGGTFDLIPGSVGGMAIGRAWCKGPKGSFWWVGTQGGLYYMIPGGGGIEHVSLKNIEQRLRGIDFTTHTVRLVWNYADNGLHIFRTPLGTPGDPTEHYFWSAKYGGTAWPDTFEADVEPTCCYVIDGDDPEDRVLLLGGRDGFIRKWDAAAGDDDGFAIDRSVLVGPLVNSDASSEYKFTGPRVVLATNLDGCEYELFATDDPSVIGPALHSGSLVAGRNPLFRTKVRGAYCFVRLSNRQVGQRFAVEEIGMMSAKAGRKRVRGGG